MADLVFVKQQYTKLRDAAIRYMDRLSDACYTYQPDPLANACAWIIPHNVVFERIKVHDLIEAHAFEPICTADQIEVYKPGVAGYAFSPAELLSKAEAVALMQHARGVTVAFLDGLIDGSVTGVDTRRVFELFQRNFAHETEHYGQVKYLHNVYTRMQERDG